MDELRMDYRVEGEGSYTIIFDGDIGTTLEEWTPIVEKLMEKIALEHLFIIDKDMDIVIFHLRVEYQKSRQGIKNIIKKSWTSGPYIIVGEGYGSLVLTSFAEQFKDLVAAAIMIDPINEKYTQTNEYKKSQTITKIRRLIEK